MTTVAGEQRIVIAGIGALGSHLVPLLRNLPADLVVVDFDRVEKKNVASQFYGTSTVGQTKVEALKRLMLFLYAAPVQAKGYRISEANVDVLLAGATLVVDCLDNGDARRLVQGFVRRHKVPCVHGALAADGSFARVMWDEAFVIDNEDVVGQPTCDGGEHLPFIAATAAWLAQAVQTFCRSGKQFNYYVSPANVILL